MKRLTTAYVFVLLFCAIHARVYALPDTLRISLPRADSLLISNNFRLLALELNIEASQAMELQARLYPNPVFSAEFNLVDPQNNRVLHVGPGGETGVQIEQLIRIGGKRKSEIELARLDTRQAELMLQDLLRNLKLVLHTSLFALHEQQLMLNRYDRQLLLLDTLIQNIEPQVKKNNIPLSDLVRLKNLYLSINNLKAELYSQYYTNLKELQILLQTRDLIVLETTEQDYDQLAQPLDTDILMTRALEKRPDLLQSMLRLQTADRNLLYQKRLRTPDINLYLAYDQQGGAFRNQVNAGFSIPLPLWNRNQGAMKAAGYQRRAAELEQQAMQNQIEVELLNTIALFQRTVAEYRKTRQLYNDDYELLMKGYTENFMLRNISLLEFADFFESYLSSMSEVLRIKIQLANVAELLKALSAEY